MGGLDRAGRRREAAKLGQSGPSNREMGWANIKMVVFCSNLMKKQDEQPVLKTAVQAARARSARHGLLIKMFYACYLILI